MSNYQPLIAAIHDLSGFGRCSLTVILPVLSVMGIQTVPIPTAVLSTHTGGLGDVEFRDLTDYMQGAMKHYQRLGLGFDCIYSGFLASEDQIDHCLDFFNSYPKALAVVDPVMGDHGKPYKTYTDAMQRRMIELVEAADIITPNLTEACILLGDEYRHEPLTREKAKSLLTRLSELGPRFVVITGVMLGAGQIVNIGFDRERSAFWNVPSDFVPVSYPGTGDIFASVLTGAFLTGASLPMAMERATGFVELAVKTTFGYGTDTRYGVMLEKSLGWLLSAESRGRYSPL